MSRYMMVTVTKAKTDDSFTGATHDDGLQSLWPVYTDGGGLKYASVLDQIHWGREITEEVYNDYMNGRVATPDVGMVETGRRFIYDNIACELVPSRPHDHDDYVMYVEVEEDGELLYTSGNEEEHYTLVAEEFGPFDESVVLRAADMYVVCRQCGEAFDDLLIAYTEHIPGVCGSDAGFDIVTEAEAF